MPRFIPVLDPNKIGNKGEREVYLRLASQLPDDWVVRYHYPACWMQGSCLRDCEADFIIVVPDRGIMVLEVKSSAGYECDSGLWYRIGSDGSKIETKNPIEQAMGTSHRLVERIAKDVFGTVKDKFPGIYGYLVLYPFARVDGRFSGSIDPRLVLIYKDMDQLRDRIESTFLLWGPETRGLKFTKDHVHRTAEFLSDRCRFVPVLASGVDSDEQIIQQLTLQQYGAFRSILSNPRVLTSGTAGSGKTMLAAWAAQNLAEKGERILLVCFNRLLARWLQATIASPNLVVKSFFSLCRERVVAAKLPFDVPSERAQRERFWTQVAPETFNQALSQHSDDLFDAVFVDEAQDFHPNWWMPIQLLLNDPDHGRLYLFLDPHQEGVYGKGGEYPDAGMTQFVLAENCRNTRRITKYCGSILTQEIPSFELSPVGVTPQVLSANEDPAHRAQTVRRLVSNLVTEGFQPSRIAILSPWDPDSKGASLNYLSNVGQTPIVTSEDSLQQWRDGKAIWGGTIKSFKGLEADCVVVTDVPTAENKAFTVADLFVAASRAKHRLAFIPATNDAEKMLLQWCTVNGEPGK